MHLSDKVFSTLQMHGLVCIARKDNTRSAIVTIFILVSVVIQEFGQCGHFMGIDFSRVVNP